jgi:hypothetical protein
MWGGIKRGTFAPFGARLKSRAALRLCAKKNLQFHLQCGITVDREIEA